MQSFITSLPQGSARYKTTTLRDFGGGLNVVDTQLNMNARFSPVFRNIRRALDGSLSPRWGYKIFADGKDGTVTSITSATYTVDTTNTSKIVNIAEVGHTKVSGDHVNISGFSSAIGGFTTADLTGVFTVTKVDADNWSIRLPTAATSTVSASRDFAHDHNTHVFAGMPINCWYYQDHVICIDSYGCGYKITDLGVVTRIWDDTFARAISGAPNAWTTSNEFCSAAVFKGDLIICNGVDKPIIVNLDGSPEVGFLVDIPTGSNANVPVCRYVIAMPGYLVMAGDPVDTDVVHISHEEASGTWQGDPAPNVATQKNIGAYTGSFNQDIKGIQRFRNFLLAAFDDAIVPLTLGTYDSGGNHVPAISETVSSHGTIAHHSMVSLGNDVLMVDNSGVPGITEAIFASKIRPNRESELVDPLIQNNIQRLTIGESSDRVFALFDKIERQYLLFMPRHQSGVTSDLGYNPISTLEPNDNMIRITFPTPHNLAVSDTFTLSGATAIDGHVSGDLNTTQTVSKVITPYIILIESTGTSVNGAMAGGGASCVVTYIEGDTNVYAYKTVDRLKIKAWGSWDHFQDIWRCGCVTALGRVILGSSSGIFYVMGNDTDPVRGDQYNVSDAVWATSTAYAANDRIRSPVSDIVYNCVEAHTSRVSGTMEQDLLAFPGYWEEYKGRKISWEWETPWADFDKRMELKINKFLGLDVEGFDIFTAQMFTDKVYSSRETGDLLPALQQEFVGGSAGGFGDITAAYGGGFLTADERPVQWEARYKIAKMRFFGETDKDLRFVAMSFAYLGGKLKR